eukprot:5178697-Pleurochrysis_carterae.AAC.1
MDRATTNIANTDVRILNQASVPCEPRITPTGARASTPRCVSVLAQASGPHDSEARAAHRAPHPASER